MTPADLGAATSAQGALADTAVQPADLSSYVTSTSLTTTLGGYTTTTTFTTTLGDYVTTVALTAALASYVTASALTAALASYTTTAALSALLAGKASSAQGALADTALQAGTIGNDPTIKRIRTLALAAQ